MRFGIDNPIWFFALLLLGVSMMLLLWRARSSEKRVAHVTIVVIPVPSPGSTASQAPPAANKASVSRGSKGFPWGTVLFALVSVGVILLVAWYFWNHNTKVDHLPRHSSVNYMQAQAGLSPEPTVEGEVDAPPNESYDF